MKFFLKLGFCCLLASCAMAQRGGARGGAHATGTAGAVRSGGPRSGGFRGYYTPYLSAYPWYGTGFYYAPYIGANPYTSNYPYTVNDYSPTPNVTVIYAQPPAPDPVPVPVYKDVAPVPAGPSYDQYGQEIKPEPAADASPIYLVAMKDQGIVAAAAYWVDGKTLHYLTLQHQEKQVPLDLVDHSFSQQLNRERHVAFHLPE